MDTTIFATTDTYALMAAVENIKKPATYLADVFFPNIYPVFYTQNIAVEYRDEGRRLAPYVVSGGAGVNVSRTQSKVNYYSAPQFAPRRVISTRDIERRQFGEMPIFSTMTPQERAAALQAQDLADLLRFHANRKNKMAADILQTGKAEMKAYADDGRILEVEEIDLGWTGAAQKDWTATSADIYGDLKAASESIQERTGTIPTLAVCGKGVEELLLKNKKIYDWLMIANRQNMAVMNIEPKYIAPQVRYIGTISALNMELVSYAETYIDENGETKPFIDDYSVIIANPGKGKVLRGAITVIEDSGFKTYGADYVPVYDIDKKAGQVSLTLYARYLLIPEVLDDWVCLTVKSA